MNNKKNSNFQQGYSKYINDKELENASKIDDNKNEKKYHKKSLISGIFPTILICIIFISTFLFTYLYGKKNNIDSVVIASAISFFSCMIWFISRQPLTLRIRYSTKKYFDYLTMKEKRLKRNILVFSKTSNTNSYSDYEIDAMYKKRNSIILFWTTTLIFTFLFIISIIVSLT